MKCNKYNIGPTDRNIRIIIGVAILAIGYFYQSWFGLVGLLPLLSTIFKVCPLYWTCHINTYCEDEEKKRKEKLKTDEDEK